MARSGELKTESTGGRRPHKQMETLLNNQLLAPTTSNVLQPECTLPAVTSRKTPLALLPVSLDDLWRVMKLLAHPQRHFHLRHVMLHENTRQLLRRHPKLAYKYLVDYASKALSTEQRALLLADHYRFVQTRLSASFINAISNGQMCLWQSQIESRCLSIYLDFPETMHTEGDLRLTLKIDGVEVYRLIFIIGSGASLGVDATHAILITCVQGLQPLLELRATTALCKDVHPSHLLIAALSGFAQAVDVHTLVGIRTRDQIANTGRIFFSYDDFFAKYGALNNDLGTYVISLPLEQKSIALIPAKHRNRTRTKRAFRQLVGESASATLARFTC